MTIPSIMRCNMVSASIAAIMGIKYTPIFGGWWMIVWFESDSEKAEFFAKYKKAKDDI